MSSKKRPNSPRGMAAPGRLTSMAMVSTGCCAYERTGDAPNARTTPTPITAEIQTHGLPVRKFMEGIQSHHTALCKAQTKSGHCARTDSELYGLMLRHPFGVEIHPEAGAGGDLDLTLRDFQRRGLTFKPDVGADLLE